MLHMWSLVGYPRQEQITAPAKEELCLIHVWVVLAWN